MPGYEYVLSEATSYPDGEGVKQKLGFKPAACILLYLYLVKEC